MRDHRPTLSNKLFESGEFKTICQKAEKLTHIQHLLENAIPKAIQGHSRISNVDNGIITIEVSNATIKMLLERQKRDIMNKLSQQGIERLVEIHFRINPSLYVQNGQKNKVHLKGRKPLSTASASLLEEVAESAPERLKLRLKAIAKLSR
ncbi:DciA family protein [Vibrio sp.]|nr:DciA family protein [Vibrio sp.]